VRTQGREKLLVSILDPNRDVLPNFVAHTAETKEGDTVTGLLVRQSETEITLRQAGGTEVTLVRDKLGRLRADGRSLMPDGLEQGLTPQDFADLLAFVAGDR